MHYIFSVKGHENISSRHKNTFEITKEKEVTPRGDCIVGVKADYSLNELKKFKGKVRITIQAGNLKEEIRAEVNDNFDDNKELVVRKSDFLDKRTFGTRADKAAADFSRMLVERLKDKNQETRITISTEE